MKKGFNNLDRKILFWFNDTLKNKFLDKFMYLFTYMGGWFITTTFLGGLFIFGEGRTRLIGGEGLIALGISQSIVNIIKRALERERPYKILENINTFGFNLKDYSFPSGHTTAGFTIATVLSLNIPSFSILFYLIAITIGISRMYLGVHYPTDVAAGIILGTLTSIIVHFKLLIYIEKLMKYFGLI